ncbi:MAG: rod shape-determining protein MreC [Planctomycetota bacterium]|nr:rod shape-determining protein MreC [Planctomycetota bacterium]
MSVQAQASQHFRRYVLRVGLLLVALYFVHKGDVWDSLRGTIRNVIPLDAVGSTVANDSISSGSAEVLELTRQLQARDEEVVRLHRRLATLTHFRERFGESYPRAVPARVIYRRDTHTLRRSITVDRGSVDGVHVGAPVIWGAGLVGLVKVVSSSSSDVLLITDADCRVDALVRNSGPKGRPGSPVGGILVGNPPAGCRLEFVPRTAKGISKGAVIYASGWRGRIPVDLVLGTVLSVSPGNNPSLIEVEVDPAVDVDHLSEVVILLRQDTSQQPENSSR